MIELNPSCKEQLIRQIADAIADIKVKNGMFIDRLSLGGLADAERVLPSHGVLRDDLVNYISDLPVTEFVTDCLQTDLFDLNRYQSEPPTSKLVDVDGYSNPRANAENIVAQFQSLPWNYTLTIFLPTEVSNFLWPQDSDMSCHPH